MARASMSTTRLITYYGEMTSLEGVLKALGREGIDVEHPQARDLYERDLDCQNLGGYSMLDVLATTAAEHGSPKPHDTLLDVGCGMGGPGRFLADRFGCSVLGVDLLPLRVEVAAELTKRSGLAERITYQVADATELTVNTGAFAQVWMLDVSIHVRDKAALFAQIARVLQPGGLLVMHDQPGPLPKAMAPATKGAPFIAPTLPQLVRYVEGAGLRVLTWRDSTARIVAYWRAVKARMEQRVADKPSKSSWPERLIAFADAYIEALTNLGGRTGILVGQRQS